MTRARKMHRYTVPRVCVSLLALYAIVFCQNSLAQDFDGENFQSDWSQPEGFQFDGDLFDYQSVAEIIELAQVRRRPGGKAPKRRERKELDGDRIPAATTPAQAEVNRQSYKQSRTERPLAPEDQVFVPIGNRFMMFYKGNWWDPYNQNVWKGDLRLFGTDEKPWFIELGAISDTLIEPRSIPLPVGLQSNSNAGSTDVFGDFDTILVNQNFIFRFSLIRGNTTFRPQDIELRLIPVLNFNHVNTDEVGAVRADPARGTSRDDAHFSFIEAFIDYHLADISDRYDFVSTRIGIQKFNSDFRGFVFSEEVPGVRFFGNLDNNKYQWNLAWFHRLERDANALLLKLFESRREDVFVANLYRQDAFVKGHDIQFSVLYRDDQFSDEGANFDENGFLTSPASIGDERFKNIRTTYLGFNTNGHVDRLNINSALYYAFGSESHNPIAGQGVDISAYMAALELSVDIDWLRPKVSFFYASGDSDPFDDKAEGFDAIFDNPVFAGGDNSYWQRQGVPLIAGGGVNLTNRLSLLANLRPGKEQGQSNFVNPGIMIFNAGLDLDVTPTLLMENNVNWLFFDQTEPLEAARQDGDIDEEIGVDISSSFLYRPFLNNNVQFRLGAALLLPGDGLENLYGDKVLYSAFTNFIFQY